MKTKRIIACIISCGIVGSSYISVEAKVIDPVLVKSETWGGTYYVSDGLEEYQGEYPYLTYKADIYSDATIKLTIYNNHEWNSFVYDPSVRVYFGFEHIGQQRNDTQVYELFTDYLKNIIGSEESEHLVEMCSDNLSMFTSTKSIHDYIDSKTKITDQTDKTAEKYLSKTVSMVKDVENISKSIFEYNIEFSNINNYHVFSKDKLFNVPKEEKENNDYSFTPHNATFNEFISIKCDYVATSGQLVTSYSETNELFNMVYYEVPSYNGLLGNLPVGEDNPLYTYTLYPEKYPKDETSIIIAGHTITITPELLNSDTVEQNRDPRDVYIEQLESQVSYLQEQLNQSTQTTTNDKLEVENALLRQENTELKNRINILATGTYGDVTGDEAVTVEDSMWVLMYYTEHDVALKTQDSFLDWCIKRKSS